MTWRQFRTQAIVGALALAAAAIYLLVLGLNIHADYDGSLAACIAKGCAPGLVSGFEDKYSTVVMLTDLALMAVPGLLGAFWGAPLIGGELASGTHRLAWQQSVTRTRWLTVKLLVVGLTAVIGTGLLDLLMAWGVHQHDTVKAARFSSLVFGARGIVPFSYAAFAFTLGAATGLLLRRPIAATGLTLAVFAAVQFVVPTALRSNYLPPRTADIRLDTTTLSHADGIVLSGSSLMIGGISLPDAWVVSAGHAVDPAGQPPNTEKLNNCLAPGQFDRTVDCLAEQDLHVTATYQPNTRYWPFQLIEAALYTAMAAALSGFCFFWIRRRTT
ncbi:ABC transporter permease [Kitasatospora aureofaciens]|uniref:ABC transporter permease n=1 Tax=Kitasatospora aureofaciens TaxID=1894 RepID=UPI001C438B9D|nr:ABC transporter permease [Kitasatospora aureofaciens]MBV6698992.1 ABC transporter permease [Kitasatospora aureofaciens]